jgi:hypothetical protein
MIKQHTLEEIIRSKVHLGPVNSRGFHEVKCEVCHDHTPRGGFRFDGESVGYSCWNCGIKTRYEEGSGRLSRNFRQVLEAFGITRDDLTLLRSSMFSDAPLEKEVTIQSLKQVKLHTPEVALPEKSQPIGVEGHESIQLPLAEYLLNRGIDPVKVKAHFSLDPRFMRRVIIPFYRDGKIIYWQARHIDQQAKPRYLNCSASRDAVIYGYDQLYSGDVVPLFVTEGVFDAIVLDGICLLGAALNEAKIEILKRTRRRIIFVIDRDRTGGELGRAVIDSGWEFSFVDPRVKDPNESVVRFGLPYTIYYLLRNANRSLRTAAPAVQLGLGLLEGKLRNRK